MSAPTLGGVLETALYVDEMPRARDFYEGVLGLETVFADERMTALRAGPASMLLLFARRIGLEGVDFPDGGHIPPHDGDGPLHIAFSVTHEALDDWQAHLARHGIEIEGRNDWPRGGRSVYFRDPDGHMLELATSGLWPGH